MAATKSGGMVHDVLIKRREVHTSEYAGYGICDSGHAAVAMQKRFGVIPYDKEHGTEKAERVISVGGMRGSWRQRVKTR